MPRPGRSHLTYALTRHYPFPWFDWVVAIFVILCLTLFTIINLATAGYNLQTKYTLDPNGTLSHRHWFQKAPLSWINSFSPLCQGASISKGSSYFTTNLGLIYTVDKISKPINGTLAPVPAISYFNTTLENCTLDDIDIQFQRREYSQQSRWAKNFWTWDGSYAVARATCDVIADSQIYHVRFATSLPIIRYSVNDGLLGAFVQLDNRTHPGIWWGANLLDLWYPRLAMAMVWLQNLQDGSRIDSAQFFVWPNTTHTDITSLNFFSQASLIYSNNNGTFYSAAPSQTVITLQDLSENVNGTWPEPLSQIAVNVDVFAKSLYSTILTDFGQPGRSNAFSNISDGSGIKYLSSALSDVSEKIGGSANSTFVKPNDDILQIDAYDALKHEIPLRVEPATIYAQYVCSIPKLKDVPSLIVSIIIGDVVLLQVAWAAFKWVTSKLLESRDKEAHWCEGCLVNDYNNESVRVSVAEEEEKAKHEHHDAVPGTRPRSPTSSDLLLPTSPRPNAQEKQEERNGGLHKAETC